MKEKLVSRGTNVKLDEEAFVSKKMFFIAACLLVCKWKLSEIMKIWTIIFVPQNTLTYGRNNDL